MTASTSEAYAFVFKLLADPGDEVLVPSPSYPLFDYLAALDSVRVVQYPLVYHGGWAIDLDALTRSITSRSRAIVLVNPNNPTGSFLKQSELGPLLALCSEHGLALISDEVFADYVFDGHAPLVRSLTGVDEVLTFCLSGLSKVAALPQVKLGWIVTGGPPGLRGKAFERLELIADTYLSVSASGAMGSPRAARPARPNCNAKSWGASWPTGPFSRVKSALLLLGICSPPKAGGTRSSKRLAFRVKRNGC